MDGDKRGRGTPEPWDAAGEVPEPPARSATITVPPSANALESSAELMRPLPPPDPRERQRFEQLAISSMRSTSDGLVALLRDHPELVSSELAKEAQQHLPQVGPQRTQLSIQSYPGTPHEPADTPSNLFPSSMPSDYETVSVPLTASSAGPASGATTPNTTSGPASLAPSRRTSFTRPSLSRGPSFSRAPSLSRRGSSHSRQGSHMNAEIPMPTTPGTEARPAMWYPTGMNMASLTAHSTPNLGQTGTKPDYSQEKIVVAMVGLPARGKSYLSNKLMRYLKWREYDVCVFNVGQMRRAMTRRRARESGNSEVQTAAFFDNKNPEGKQMRNELSHMCLEQLIRWLKHGGNVGIHDATNTTRARRREIAERVAREPGLRLMFLETVCTDPEILAKNVEVKVSSGDPDYDKMSREEAKADFLRRIKHYEEVYEPLDADGTERGLSYCKIINLGRTAIMNNIGGYLESQIAFYLRNLHVTPRNIFFSRHGESQYNVQGKIGGDSDLSERGWAYARALPKLIHDNIGDAPLTVWHSSLRRTAQTASFLDYPKLIWKSLDELDAGVCDSMTYEEIERYYPEDYASRDEDKFNYRYRGGESYRDIVVRLEPVIMELERQDNILIVGHQAVLRCLYAYFNEYKQSDLPYIKIPLHTVIKLTPKAYGCDEERYQLPIEAVDTHRPRPRPPRPPPAAEEDKAGGATGVEDELIRAALTEPPSQRRQSGPLPNA